MSKEILNATLSGAKMVDAYNWNLYFVKIGGKKQRYTAHTCKFTKSTYLYEYAVKLIDCIKNFNIEAIENVEDYNAFNTKVSCDKISVDDDKIADTWKKFQTSIANSSTDALVGNIHLYLLSAEPTQGNDKLPSISFIKFANPVTKLKDNKAIIFKIDNNDEFEEISDDIMRLYLAVDSILINSTLYCFNHKFETPFGLDKAAKIVKEQVIDRVATADFLADFTIFENAAKGYNARTFLSFDEGRIQNLTDVEKRKKYAQLYDIELDINDKLILTESQQANEIIKYICLKIIREHDTDTVYEISNAVKIT